MTPRYEIMQGDVLDRLREMKSESVHCVCTSPPYWGLRDYGTEGQIGCEKRMDCLGWATGQKCGVCHACVIVSVFREVRRVLRKDGTLWLNYGDCYASGTGRSYNRGYQDGGVYGNDFENGKPRFNIAENGLKPKDLCMVPARVALALQADGWWLRSEIIWAKGNPMPESVTDRPTSAHEKIYLLSKSERYYYDADAVREKSKYPDDNRAAREKHYDLAKEGINRLNPATARTYPNRNLRNVWKLNTEPYAAAHFATYPTAIPKRAILAGTSEKGVCPCCGAGWRRMVEKENTGASYGHVEGKEGALRNDTAKWAGRIGETKSETLGWQPSCDCGEEETIPATVLDPFLGSGTTVAVALSLGRRGIGIELNEEYVKLAEERIAPYAAQEILPF